MNATLSPALLTLSAAAAVIYVTAMQQDLARRQIPNILSIGLLLLAVGKWLIVGSLSGAIWSVAAGSIVFLVTFVLFARGWMGGGDVKLLTASSLFLGAWLTYPFVVCTALAGGFITLGVIAKDLGARWLRPAHTEGNLAVPQSRTTVPYGVAISIGALWVMAQQLVLSHATMLR